MTHIAKLTTILLMLSLVMACANEEVDDTGVKAKEPFEITVTGTAEKVTFGKDGYMTTLITADGVSYEAVVSIVNMGGPDNYKSMNVGDKATVKGIKEQTGNKLRVIEIVSIESQLTALTIMNNSF